MGRSSKTMPAGLKARVIVLCVLAAAAAGAVSYATASPGGRHGGGEGARAAAGRLFARLRLPSGATQVPFDPSAAEKLGAPFVGNPTPGLVDVHRFWRVEGVACKVMSWIYQHPPAGSHILGAMGPSPDACRMERLVYHAPAGRLAVPLRTLRTPTAWGVEFAFGWQGERFDSRALLVTVRAAEGGGTAIRVDATARRMLARPASERIPRGVMEVAIRVVNRGSHISLRQTVRAPRKIARIVAIVESLPRSQPSGPVNCPAIRLPPQAAIIRLRFTGAGSKPLGSVKIDENGCSSITVRLRGRSQPELAGAAQARRRLQAVLHRML